MKLGRDAKEKGLFQKSAAKLFPKSCSYGVFLKGDNPFSVPLGGSLFSGIIRSEFLLNS
jgi:hypothetical protein